MQKIYFEDMPLNKTHLKVGVSGIGGQFCDGFILGVIGISMELAKGDLGLDEWWLGAIGAASLLGLFFGALLTGVLADKVGRKPIFIWTMPVFFIVSILQFYVSSAFELFVLRFILGLALGADYVVGISLVSEITPKKYRGKLLSAMMVGWVGGYTIAYFVGFALQDFSDGAWRWILLSSALPSCLVMLLRINTPASPLWLVKKGQIERANEVIKKYFGEHILAPKAEEYQHARYFDLFNAQNLKNTLVGIVFYGAQVIPYFAISTFIPSILASLKVEDPYIGGIIYNLFLFIGSVLGLYIINKISRKLFVVGSFYILAIIMIALAAYSFSLPSYLVIILISIFSCVLAGAGVLEFAYTPELFPTNLRASGVGLVVACSRISGTVGTFLLPIITSHYSISVALWIVFASLAFAGVFCHAFAPQTYHKELS
ncbi:MFS transporter [Helicobacter aurati]|uniref:MFS transporter n=1 Tax=Helicobacter aurati TaxID=137778 RepID=A0A3D8J0Q1_9HELI|nr:MFS transporter [Helicobacter aurati]RDU71068.1 MFS transporter [Helicobacter aurati]